MTIIEIITVGDSHSRIAFQNIFTKNHGINSYYMHKFNNEYNSFMHIFNEFIRNINEQKNTQAYSKKQILILCFGEVDARCLIHEQITEKNRNEDEVIEDLIINFENVLLKIFKSLSLQDRKKIFIMSIVPTSKEMNLTGANQRGSVQDRRRYTEKMNKLLKEHMEKCGFTFFDIYDFYLDKETGTIRDDLADDVKIHIQNQDFLVQELYKYISSIIQQ